MQCFCRRWQRDDVPVCGVGRETAATALPSLLSLLQSAAPIDWPMKHKREYVVRLCCFDLSCPHLVFCTAGKYKHKVKSEKKKIKHELKRLRRAEKRKNKRMPFSENEDDNVHGDDFHHVENPVCLRRQSQREDRRSEQRKARELTISRFRQIVLSDASGDEEAASVSSAPSASHGEEPRIPSVVAKKLRKQVNKLSQIFDSSLSFNPEQETENTAS